MEVSLRRHIKIKVLCPHYTGRILKYSSHFGFVFEENSGKSHDYCEAPTRGQGAKLGFRKSSIFKRFFIHTKMNCQRFQIPLV